MSHSRSSTSDLSDTPIDTNPPTNEMDPSTNGAEPVKSSRKTDDDSVSDTETVEPTQLEEIKAMLEERGLDEKFETFLPSGEDYTFMDRASVPDNWGFKIAGGQGPLLFLGENAEVQTWASIGLPQKNGRREVTFRNVPLGSQSQLGERVNKLAQMSLMYPMKIFKIKNRTNNLEHLKHLIKYLYLCTGKFIQVFTEDHTTASDQLRAAINCVEGYYDDQNGGWENAPKIHGPGSGMNDDAIAMDGREQGLVRTTRASKSKSDAPVEEDEADSARPGLESVMRRGSSTSKHDAPSPTRQPKADHRTPIASGTEGTESSKRRREGSPQTDKGHTLKHRKKMAKKEVKWLQKEGNRINEEGKRNKKELKAKEAEVAKIHAALLEHTDAMSRAELAASFIASSEDSNESITEDEE